jgi:hypothetical protein
LNAGQFFWAGVISLSLTGFSLTYFNTSSYGDSIIGIFS